MSDPADLNLVDASALLAAGRLSATELLEACLARIAIDGPPTHDGDPGAVNAFVRVYEAEARAGAVRAGERLSRARAGGDPAPALCGIPIGLKDLYAVAGRPLTASSRVADLAPSTDCVVWTRLAVAGAVLVGHLHTHEWAAGGSTDQVGNPWARERTAGGSSGGSAAALAARMIPGATGTDTAGSLRIPSALSGTSTLKPTRGRIPLDGVIPLSTSLDHAGPMARTLADCRVLLAGMLGGDAAPAAAASLEGARLAISPRVEHADVEGEVAAGLESAAAAAQALGATLVSAPAPDTPLEVAGPFFDVLGADMLAYHQRFDDRRADYRASTRELLGLAEARAMSAAQYDEAQRERALTTAHWEQWFADQRIDAMLEPTVPLVAPVRGRGYDHFIVPDPFVEFTYLWDWTGFPVAAMPAGLGATSGLPVGVSLIGPAGADDRILALAIALQQALPAPVVAL